ncbi:MULTISPECIES: hypothetical protein [Streptomyces]|uniref:Streptomyces killer toxin-like beta/gamma crystallin domain-containing protein n=1 Tax=Streptomyces lycii TaxID=2654337 RepID=A0ABQ7FHR0_9ACTN|nr:MULTISPECIES: hypothetical protein [Streptomyces]KAF4408541.1 hypothetical protein GCU69_14015 [Streptomyces lycii]
MRIPAKTVTVVTMGLATVLFAAAPSSAASFSWTRSCNTTYYAVLNSTAAETSKGPNGSCAGYAYVKVKRGDTWYNWKSDPKVARIYQGTGGIKITESMHKGCSGCEVHTLHW